MENSYFIERFKPKLNKPVLIEGLTGLGNVGKVTAQLLNQLVEAKLFAEYYSSFFPDYVVVSSSGVCSPPRYEFYASSPEDESSLVVLTGDSQPPLGNVVAHYKVCGEILDFVQKLGCKLVVTVGGVPVSSGRKDVYVAATSTKLAAKIVEKGGVLYGEGRIMGATGLLLGLAKERGLDGVCLLGATSGLQSDKDAAEAVFKLLLKILGREEKAA